ncbi:peptidase inhibitor family I36 protein [Aliivibrio sifiae]|uniref:Beta/gamma crystallin 'Greek key' domain-containing protein n=1 Tax=Aliivibrio sifiae TaxID=566293 RepID=A0A2S7X9T6_9GAMM|nr:peptidase inhibitor family I36 protein [Aliivibrio sifiae]PQJ88099.1 hypothetical protein BTO22_00205 [Aliivibrio sifiae]
MNINKKFALIAAITMSFNVIAEEQNNESILFYESKDTQATERVALQPYQYLSENINTPTRVHVKNTGVYSGDIYLEYYSKGKLVSQNAFYHVNYHRSFDVPGDAYFVRLRQNRLTGSLFEIPDIYSIKLCQENNIYREHGDAKNALQINTWGTSLHPKWNFGQPNGTYKFRNSGATCGSTSLIVYTGYDASGAYRSISSDVPNLDNFNNSISSFSIPDNWTVRFYEGENYTGRYYTRKGNDRYFENANDFNDTARSIKIISKG